VTDWYLVDHGHGDKIVRGPYDSASTASAIRRELERAGYFGNLWIVPADSVAAAPAGEDAP
jgi:hypothetical protein